MSARPEGTYCKENVPEDGSNPCGCPAGTCAERRGMTDLREKLIERGRHIGRETVATEREAEDAPHTAALIREGAMDDDTSVRHAIAGAIAMVDSLDLVGAAEALADTANTLEACWEAYMHNSTTGCETWENVGGQEAINRARSALATLTGTKGEAS